MSSKINYPFSMSVLQIIRYCTNFSLVYNCHIGKKNSRFRDSLLQYETVDSSKLTWFKNSTPREHFNHIIFMYIYIFILIQKLLDHVFDTTEYSTKLSSQRFVNLTCWVLRVSEMVASAAVSFRKLIKRFCATSMFFLWK